MTSKVQKIDLTETKEDFVARHAKEIYEIFSRSVVASIVYQGNDVLIIAQLKARVGEVLTKMLSECE